MRSHFKIFVLLLAFVGSLRNLAHVTVGLDTVCTAYA